jgi:replicative DNA helicase
MEDLKVPPHDLAAEVALIGAIMIQPSLIPQLKTQITPEDFYLEAHRHIYAVICEIRVNPDPVTIIHRLREKGLLERAGGENYLKELVVECPITSAAWRHHSTILKDLSRRRRLIEVAMNAIDAAYGLVETEDIQAEMRQGLLALQADMKTPYRRPETVLRDLFKEIEQRAQSGERWVGVRTGFSNIDERTHGLEPGSSIYLAARPSVGKTALALAIADNVAQQKKGRVLFFSLESSDTALTRRRVASKSGVFHTRLRTGNIEDGQWPILLNAINALSERELLILDDPRFKTLEALAGIAEALAVEMPLAFLLVDHIQLMNSRDRKLLSRSRHHELSYISSELSSLAKRLSCPILILCQLNREIERRSGRQYPQLSDLKESGDLEQNGDLILTLWRKDREVEATRVECLKSRDGATWITWLRFDRRIQKFSDIDEWPSDEMPETKERGFRR